MHRNEVFNDIASITRSNRLPGSYQYHITIKVSLGNLFQFGFSKGIIKNRYVQCDREHCYKYQILTFKI